MNSNFLTFVWVLSVFRAPFLLFSNSLRFFSYYDVSYIYNMIIAEKYKKYIKSSRRDVVRRVVVHRFFVNNYFLNGYF